MKHEPPATPTAHPSHVPIAAVTAVDPPAKPAAAPAPPLKEAKLVPVSANRLSSIGYDADSRVMTVVEKSGEIYRYSEVPARHHEDLMAATDVEAHWVQNFPDHKYPLHRTPPPAADAKVAALTVDQLDAKILEFTRQRDVLEKAAEAAKAAPSPKADADVPLPVHPGVAGLTAPKPLTGIDVPAGYRFDAWYRKTGDKMGDDKWYPKFERVPVPAP